MRAYFRITAKLLDDVRRDLRKPHAYAFERVGFIAAGLSGMEDDVLILARSYRPVLDDDYLRDLSVGAMMGPEAIRKALQWAMETGQSLFHVHMHAGSGLPQFSGIDMRENAKFVPDFHKVAPQGVHGALVLSEDSARGQVWLQRGEAPVDIEEFIEVGVPARRWRGK